MNSFWASSMVVCGLACSTACSSNDEPDKPKELSSAAAYDLDDIKTNPTPYDWFDFRPNIKKLILAGVPESQHIAILWYTVTDGGVALHYHAKTESVYVIDGTQTDAKGSYPTGTVYFNPPGSGHQLTDSTGFFLLSYAAPPDFASTDLIAEYEPVRIDTTDPDLTHTYPFEDQREGVKTFAPPLDSEGGAARAIPGSDFRQLCLQRQLFARIEGQLRDRWPRFRRTNADRDQDGGATAVPSGSHQKPLVFGHGRVVLIRRAEAKRERCSPGEPPPNASTPALFASNDSVMRRPNAGEPLSLAPAPPGSASADHEERICIGCGEPIAEVIDVRPEHCFVCAVHGVCACADQT